MFTAYEHETYGVTETESFIEKWMTTQSIRSYQNIGIYPNPSLCPKQNFNMWIPFAMEKYTEPYEKNTHGLEFMLNHIKIMCNHDATVYNYLVMWIAQMIQYPEVKTVIPTIISKQGAGKGSLISWFRRMLGSKKVHETSDPSRDVWGPFNGIMANAFLVNLDELSQKDMIECEGKFKALITNPEITINNKGTNQYSTTSYHRFFGTTNTLNPMKTSHDDRRNIIVYASNEKCGDTEYFNTMHRYLNDINVLRTCYDYLKSIPDMDKFNKIPLPQTEYQNNLKEMYRSPIELWLQDFTRTNLHQDVVEMLGVETYNSFDMWKKANSMVYDTNPVKLGCFLANLQTGGGITKGRHTNKGDTKYFHIEILKKHYNIGCLIELGKDEVNEAVEIYSIPLEEEEGVIEVTIQGKKYFTNNEKNGCIYEYISQEEVGQKFGCFIDGVPMLT